MNDLIIPLNDSNLLAMGNDSAYLYGNYTDEGVNIRSVWYNHNYAYWYYVTKTLIDFSQYKKIKVTISQNGATSSGNYNYLCVGFTDNTTSLPSHSYSFQFTTSTIGNRVVEFDITNIKTNQYLFFGIRENYSNWNYDITDVTLEGINPYEYGGIWDFDGTTDYQIGKVYDFNGTASNQIGKVYDFNGTASNLIYTGEETLVKDNSLQSGVELTNIITRQGTSNNNGTYLTVTAWGGAYFGLNVTQCNKDIRGFSKITGQFTPRAITGGNNGYYNIGMVIGTESEINSITYPSYGNLSTGTCDVVVKQVFTTANAYTIDFDIPVSRQTASEPIYIAFALCGYNSGTNYLTINNMVIE